MFKSKSDAKDAPKKQIRSYEDEKSDTAVHAKRVLFVAHNFGE